MLTLSQISEFVSRGCTVTVRDDGFTIKPPATPRESAMTAAEKQRAYRERQKSVTVKVTESTESVTEKVTLQPESVTALPTRETKTPKPQNPKTPKPQNPLKIG